MKSQFKLPIPVQRALRQLGKDINAARRRRRITMQLMSERAGLGRSTIGRIEKGDPTVSMGGYASVIFVLGMTDRLSTLIEASSDIVGLSLQDEDLPKRIRTPQNKEAQDEQ